MTYEKFGVKLSLITATDLQKVLLWRNSDEVRLYMDYQKIITLEEHKNWFYNLDKNTNYYFIASYNNIEFGVFNVKNIDNAILTGETGAFLISTKFWGSDIASRAILALGYFCFEEISLNSLYCHVIKSNKAALNFNKHQGYVIDENFISDTKYKLHCSKFDFLKHTNKFIKLLS
jgi:RimJ/RimL family protein N-acetyltransferase